VASVICQALEAGADGGGGCLFARAARQPSDLATLAEEPPAASGPGRVVDAVVEELLAEGGEAPAAAPGPRGAVMEAYEGGGGGAVSSSSSLSSPARIGGGKCPVGFGSFGGRLGGWLGATPPRTASMSPGAAAAADGGGGCPFMASRGAGSLPLALQAAQRSGGGGCPFASSQTLDANEANAFLAAQGCASAIPPGVRGIPPAWGVVDCSDYEDDAATSEAAAAGHGPGPVCESFEDDMTWVAEGPAPAMNGVAQGTALAAAAANVATTAAAAAGYPAFLDRVPPRRAPSAAAAAADAAAAATAAAGYPATTAATTTAAAGRCPATSAAAAATATAAAAAAMHAPASPPRRPAFAPAPDDGVPDGPSKVVRFLSTSSTSSTRQGLTYTRPLFSST